MQFKKEMCHIILFIRWTTTDFKVYSANKKMQIHSMKLDKYNELFFLTCHNPGVAQKIFQNIEGKYNNIGEKLGKIKPEIFYELSIFLKHNNISNHTLLKNDVFLK